MKEIKSTFKNLFEKLVSRRFLSKSVGNIFFL